MTASHFNIRFVKDEDIPQIRALVNHAYKELADMGLNYTATYQNEEITRDRISKGRAYVLEKDGRLLGTILLTVENYFTGRKSAYISQFAVHPKYKKQGLGSILMDHCEDLARQEKFEAIQLDTAKPAEHLVRWYQKRGYKIVGEDHYEGKTYESWIFEKDLS